MFSSKKKSLTGKVIIVTGASDGMGKLIAEGLGKEKATVVVTARRVKVLEEVARHITEAGGEALVIPAELRKTDELADLVQKTMEKFGRIDVLINVAGMGYYDWIEEQSTADLIEQYMVNVVGMMDLIRYVVPIMKQQRSGHIVNFSSLASQISTPPLTIYASTKYAIEGLTDGLRRELAPWNIRLTRVHPSAVDTNFNKKAEAHGGIHYPYDWITGVKKEEVARAVIGSVYRPKKALYLAKRKILVNFVLFLNHHVPSVIDFVFLWYVRVLWKRDRHHDSGV